MGDESYHDLYDAASDTRLRVSPAVLHHLGRDGALQLARHLKARNPRASLPNAPLATGYAYTANGLPLVATVFLLQEHGQPVPVIRITTREEWAAACEGREQRN
jgi:hypothetical protein